MDGFREGYSYFEKLTGTSQASQSGNSYVKSVEASIADLSAMINKMKGSQTEVNKLKGNIAEAWHSGTFNINAKLNKSDNRTFFDQSNKFASTDISSNFEKQYGLKYYADGAESAKQQAKSLLERYKEYQGNDSLDKFLSDRGYTIADINDPMYSEQYRLIPVDQLQDAREYLIKKIAKEKLSRPEQVKRYQDTLDKLCTTIEDENGNKSIALTKQDAEKIAEVAKEGGFDPADWGLTTEQLVSYQHIVKEAFRAGTTAAVISLVLKVAPEIYQVILSLIKNGEVDLQQFKQIGFAAISGSAEGFVRGSIAAAITTSCKAGLLGSAMKSLDPSFIGAATVIAMNAIKNSFAVATGKMQMTALTESLLKDVFISSCALAAGIVLQGIPVIGFMLGSFIGSMLGGIVYSAGRNVAISFCVNSGFTMFGLVEQNYVLPEKVMAQIGMNVFEYERFSHQKFNYTKFKVNRIVTDRASVNSIEISFLRRGVIGVRTIGYLA